MLNSAIRPSTDLVGPTEVSATNSKVTQSNSFCACLFSDRNGAVQQVADLLSGEGSEERELALLPPLLQLVAIQVVLVGPPAAKEQNTLSQGLLTALLLVQPLLHKRPAAKQK